MWRNYDSVRRGTTTEYVKKDKRDTKSKENQFPENHN